jgi:ribosomal RNA-processing protein 12
LTASRTDRRRKPGQDAARFKKDIDSGKMVIDSDDDSDNDAAQPNGPPAEDVAGNAYKESLTSVDGFTRGPNGRIKFNKDTKKRRRENEDMEDIEMADVAPPLSAKKQKKKADQPKLGHEFKAKASPF